MSCAVPGGQHLLNIFSDRLSSDVAIPPCHQVVVVRGVPVADMRSHGQTLHLAEQV